MSEPAPALPILHGATVRLRAMTQADAPAVFAIFSLPEVMRYWSSGPMREQRQAAELIASVDASARRGELMQWGITVSDEVVIGTCTLAQITLAHGRAEIGFALHPAHTGRGLMRDALGAVLRHAFGPMALRRIEADVDPRNQRSLHALETLGFRREGELRERWLVEGELQDSVLLGLLRRELPAP